MSALVAVTASVTVAVMGCSSSSSGSGGSCGKVAACGGSIVGTWKIVDACSTASSGSNMTGSCPGETVTPLSETASGTVTFNADMTYSVSMDISAGETLTVPPSCLSGGGGTVTCAQLGATLGNSSNDAGVSTTCTSSGSSCTCTISSMQNVTEMGTYVTSGNALSLTPTSSSANLTVSNDNYCVSGGTLHVLTTATSAGGMPALDLVANKQ